MADEAKVHSPIHSTSKRWLWNVQSGVVLEKNWAHSVNQYQLQLLQLSMHQFAEHTSQM